MFLNKSVAFSLTLSEGCHKLHYCILRLGAEVYRQFSLLTGLHTCLCLSHIFFLDIFYVCMYVCMHASMCAHHKYN